jgi:hypothetical protein
MSNHQSISITKEQPVDEAMQKAVAEMNAPDPADTPAPEERPGWLPEKFKSPADLAKAYSELEKRFSTPAEKSKAEPQADAGTQEGLNLEAYSKEYSDNGTLSAESIAKLASQGIPETVVRNYLEGLGALSDRQTQQIYGLAGGEEKYNSMLEWASENLDESEISAFNEIMDGGNQSTMQMAVKGLSARFSQSSPAPSKLIQGDTTGPSGGAFRSISEVTLAMKDPRYDKDPAYRRDIENRLKNSSIMNINSR